MSKLETAQKVGTKVSAEVGYRFMEADLCRSMLQDFYQCPFCETVSPVDSVYQELSLGKILKVVKLECGHSFPTFARLKPIKVQHKEVFSMYLTAEVKNSNTGELTSRLVQRSHSFVANFLQYMNYMINCIGTGQGGHNSGSQIISTYTDAVYYPISNASSMGASTANVVPNLFLNGGAGLSYVGMQVGSSNNAPTVTDYGLNALITNGSGSGELAYGASVINVIAIAGSTTSFSIVRTFTNNTAVAITAYEVGLMSGTGGATGANESADSTTDAYPIYVLLTHDLFSAAQTIPASQTLTVTYTWQTTT
jgi:hypothetical protein